MPTNAMLRAFGFYRVSHVSNYITCATMLVLWGMADDSTTSYPCRYAVAAGHYSDALRACSKGVAPAFVAVLYCNRAAALHAAGDVAQALADCGRAKALRPSYTKVRGLPRGVLRRRCAVLRRQCGVLRRRCAVLRRRCAVLRRQCGVLRRRWAVLRRQCGVLMCRCCVRLHTLTAPCTHK